MTATCDFCGLPVSVTHGTVAERNPQPVYCCFGCEFAADVTQSTGREGASRALLMRIGLAAFCTMNVLAFTMVLWSHDVYTNAPDPRASVLDGLLRYLGLLFSLPVWFLLGQPLLVSAIGRLSRGKAATDLLVCLGVLAAYGFSIVSTARSSGPVYYEVACVVLVFTTLGRWLEAQGKLHATAALDDLERLLPETVRVQRGDEATVTPLSAVIAGDWLIVGPSECISVDGTIVHGCAHIDERLLTGESWPVAKRAGDPVRAGAYNLDGQLIIAATSTAAEGSLGRLVRGLREARQHEGYYERLAERVTLWFLPATILGAVLTVGWHGWHSGWESGVMTGLAVLLIACPCALGLATPLAAWTAFSHAARHQVLFRDGEALERMAGIRALAWDKTGTLTTSEPSVSTVVWATGVSQKLLLPVFVALATQSRHPFSRALVRSFTRYSGLTPGISDFHEQPGRGLIARSANGDLLCLGNQQLAYDLGLAWPARLRAAWNQLRDGGQTVVMGSTGGSVQCLFVVSESLRAGAADTVYQLQTMGIHQQVLTGDQSPRTARLLEELFAGRLARHHHTEAECTASKRGAHPILAGTFTFRAELSPEQKVRSVRNLRANYGPVAMIGDGVNDALALTVADVGVALRSGADISRDSAAVCLFGDDIRRLPWAIDYARFTVHIIKQNLWWAFGYNTVGILLAAAGYLNPSVAAVLMAGSSAFVIANTWRLSLPMPQSSQSVSDGTITGPVSACLHANLEGGWSPGSTERENISAGAASTLAANGFERVQQARALPTVVERVST